MMHYQLDIAFTDAEEILFDQTHFYLSAEQWEKFNEVLSRPPQQNNRLKKLLETKSPWEKE